MMDNKLLDKLNETKSRLEKNGGNSTQRFKYDIEQLQRGLETCDYKSIFKILNSTNLNQRNAQSQKKPKVKKQPEIQNIQPVAK